MNSKKLLLLIFVNICSIQLIFSYNTKAIQQKINYTVDFSDYNSKKIKIKAKLTLENDTIYMAPGANHLPNRWATFISDLTVKDVHNKELKVVTNSNASWTLNKIPKEPVSIEYIINLNHEDYNWSSGIDGVSFNKPWGFFSTTRAIFIINGKDKKNIRVNFKIPKSWKISTTWMSDFKIKNTFLVKDLTELSQSMFFAGTHQEIIIKKNGFRLILALGGNQIKSKANKYSKMASGVLDYYTKLMGGLPKLGDSSQGLTFMAIINPSDKTDGEVIGNNICILIKENGNRMDKLIADFIFTHEFFHLWNGKTFSPIDNKTEWFKEGVTNYYALKALYNINLLSKKEYLSFLNSLFYQKYITDKGLGKISLLNGESKHNHWGLIYAGGLFAGIAIDIEIRTKSNNSKSLNDLMRYLYKGHNGKDKTYSLTTLKSFLHQYENINTTDIFNLYIEKPNIIPIENYFIKAGFNTTIDNNQLLIKENKNSSLLQRSILKAFYGN